MKKIIALFFALSGVFSQFLTAQTFQFKTPLYGAAYYSEYTPTDRLDEDIRLMKDRKSVV